MRVFVFRNGVTRRRAVHGATYLFPVIRLVTHERVRLSCLFEQNSFLGTLSKFPLFLLDTANTHTTENSFRMNPVS